MATFNISGSVIGKGKPFLRINYSKRHTINPTLSKQVYGYNEEDCPIAAIEYQNFTPDKLINIFDKSDYYYENTENFYIIETIEKNASDDYYPISHYPYATISSGLIDYLVTDTKSDDQNGAPLFYQYELLFDATSNSSETLISNIYENNESIIDKSKYTVQISTDLLSQGNDRYSSTTWLNSSGLFGNLTKRCRVLLPLELTNNTFYTIDYTKSVKGIQSYQKELIELTPLYSEDTDFEIHESGLIRLAGSSISDSQSLFIIKNPDSKLYPLGITPIDVDNSFTPYVSESLRSWRLMLNIGSFLQPTGVYTGDSEKFFYTYNVDPTGVTPISRIKPHFIDSNILKVDATPIYLDTSSGAYHYPNYKSPLYNSGSPYALTSEGGISLYTNNTLRNDIKITSVDREKGYLYLDKEVFPSDDVELSYYINNEETLVIDNLELNPKYLSGNALFHISGYMNGIGIAMLEYDETNDTKHPYIYDPTVATASRTAYLIPPSGGATTPMAWISGNFFTVCELNLNRLTKDVIKLTDARRIGGYPYSGNINSWFRTNYGGTKIQREHEWYTDVGYYGGAPLPHNGAVIIHIPEVNISGMRQDWIDYFASEIDDYSAAVKQADREFKHYLDQTIKRYISGGSDYILFPTVSGLTTDIMYLD